MRFLAPGREATAPEIFQHPVFAAMAEYRDLLSGAQWPSVAILNDRLLPLTHRVTTKPLKFVAQESLTGEPIHYESRIFQHGEIATRGDNWHDLLNALVWKKFPAIKSALNSRQVENIARVGTRQRTREQDALTQFDEGGAIMVLRDRRLLGLWDAHDWTGLFLRQRDAWRDGRISLSIFGHAVLEHALHPEILLAAKTLVFFDDSSGGNGVDVDSCAAKAILRGICLGDPQQLRPLPLSGISGWHRAPQDSGFYRDMPCFRPLRAGRVYPEPMPVPDVSGQPR